MARANTETASFDARETSADSCDDVDRCERALSDIFRVKRGALARLAWRLTRSRVDAEDLVQQAFLRAHERDLQMSHDQLFGWLTTVIRRLAIDRSRQSAVHLRYAELQWACGTCYEEPSSFDELDKWIRMLPVGLERTFTLWCAGLSYKAIAVAQRLPIGTVSARVLRAKMQLRALRMADQE